VAVEDPPSAEKWGRRVEYEGRGEGSPARGHAAGLDNICNENGAEKTGIEGKPRPSNVGYEACEELRANARREGKDPLRTVGLEEMRNRSRCGTSHDVFPALRNLTPLLSCHGFSFQASHHEVGSDSQGHHGNEKGPNVQVSPAVEQRDRSVPVSDLPTSGLELGAISRAMSQIQEVWPTAHGHKLVNPHPHSSPRPGDEASRPSSTSRVSSTSSPRVHEGARLSLEAKMDGRSTSHSQPPGRGSSPFAQAAQGRLLAKHGSEGDEAQVHLASELSQIISDVVKVEDLGRLGSTSDGGYGGGESSWAKVNVSQGHDGTPAHDPADSENSSAAANSSAEKGDGGGLEFGNIVVSRASSSESSRSHQSGAWRKSNAFHGAASDMQTKPQRELVDQEEFRRVASASSGASGSRARRASTAGRYRWSHMHMSMFSHVT